MIISDLNHVEVVSEEKETSIVGGYHTRSINWADANAGATASNGQFNSTYTSTYTYTARGYASSSSGSSSTTESYW